jgi:hypothetical protein
MKRGALQGPILWPLLFLQYTGGPPYPQVIRSKTYRGYGKPRVIPNAVYVI